MITGLLLVVARLVHLHLPDTLSCLASQPAPHGVQSLAWFQAKGLCGTSDTSRQHTLASAYGGGAMLPDNRSRAVCDTSYMCSAVAMLNLAMPLYSDRQRAWCILMWTRWEQADRATQRWRL